MLPLVHCWLFDFEIGLLQSIDELLQNLIMLLMQWFFDGLDD